MRTHQEMDGTVAAGEEGGFPSAEEGPHEAQCGVRKKRGRRGKLLMISGEQSLSFPFGGSPVRGGRGSSHASLRFGEPPYSFDPRTAVLLLGDISCF